MGFAEDRGEYWRGRYKIRPGEYGTVQDDQGHTIRFKKKLDAERAANEEEAKVRNGTWRNAALGLESFGSFASRWYAEQDLAKSTMQNYLNHIENHLLPTFALRPIASITRQDYLAWEREERAAGYAESSISSWRATLHLIFEDAKDEGLITSNPAAKRRGRGRRTARGSNRGGKEKAVTSALGILLIAERMALLSGRDDEFVAGVTLGYTGMRFGEFVGLETSYIRPGALRVEWQLYELDTGELHRCPPKDESRRTVDLPGWLSSLLAGQAARSNREPCQCHGYRYAFSGHRAANGSSQVGPKMADVARLAGVSISTVSLVLNQPHRVVADTALRVEKAIAELGYVQGRQPGELAAHHRRSGFATWIFRPAASGWYPTRGGQSRPVPVLGEPWPGIPARGSGALKRADACWLPIEQDLTPHGDRHTHKTIMDELGTPSQLKDERLGHFDGSVPARYSHVTADMRRTLMDQLTQLWTASLAERFEISPRSPVATLDRLLQAFAAARV
jgi:integrase